MSLHPRTPSRTFHTVDQSQLDSPAPTILYGEPSNIIFSSPRPDISQLGQSHTPTLFVSPTVTSLAASSSQFDYKDLEGNDSQFLGGDIEPLHSEFAEFSFLVAGLESPTQHDRGNTTNLENSANGLSSNVTIEHSSFRGDKVRATAEQSQRTEVTTAEIKEWFNSVRSAAAGHKELSLPGLQASVNEHGQSYFLNLDAGTSQLAEWNQFCDAVHKHRDGEGQKTDSPILGFNESRWMEEQPWCSEGRKFSETSLSLLSKGNKNGKSNETPPRDDHFHFHDQTRTSENDGDPRDAHVEKKVWVYYSDSDDEEGGVEIGNVKTLYEELNEKRKTGRGTEGALAFEE